MAKIEKDVEDQQKLLKTMIDEFDVDKAKAPSCEALKTCRLELKGRANALRPFAPAIGLKEGSPKIKGSRQPDVCGLAQDLCVGHASDHGTFEHHGPYRW